MVSDIRRSSARKGCTVVVSYIPTILSCAQLFTTTARNCISYYFPWYILVSQLWLAIRWLGGGGGGRVIDFDMVSYFVHALIHKTNWIWYSKELCTKSVFCFCELFPRSYHVSRARIFKRLRIPGMDSASLCSLAGRYDNPICRTFLGIYSCASSTFTNSGSAYHDNRKKL